MNKKIKIAIILVILLISPHSIAAEFSHSLENSASKDTEYLGLLAGANGSTLSTSSPGSVFGITFGTKLSASFGLGVLGSYYVQSSTGRFLGIPTGTTVSTMVFTAQANYFTHGFHLGGEIGAGINNWSSRLSALQIQDYSSSSLIFGPEVGYDYMVGKFISIGAEGHYFINTVSEGVSNLQLLASIKIWQ